MMIRAILTGFEPFGDYRFNPTQDLAREYDGKNFDGIEIVGLVLPCTYYGAFAELLNEMKRLSPEIVLSTGLASRVTQIRIEAFGRNLMNGKYPDARGLKPDNELIVQGGQPFYKTNADNIMLANKLHDGGIPSEVSVDAEGFVCNSLVYLTMARIYAENIPVKYAFAHTPWTDDYLGKIQLEPGKVTIRKKDLERAVGILLRGIAESTQVIELSG